MLLALREQSDSLCTPYWSGLLGSFSPSRYNRVPFPPDLQWEECCPLQLHYRHYAAECPAHFARVRGERPPGWMTDQLGAVVKDPAAWTGQTLFTDAARAQYRGSLGR